MHRTDGHQAFRPLPRLGMRPAHLVQVVDALDLVLIVVCALLAKLVYVEGVVGDMRSPNPYIAAGVLCAFFAMGLLRTSSARNVGSHTFALGEAVRLLVSLLLAFAFTICVGYLAKVAVHFSRGWLVLWFALAYASLIATRLLRRPLMRSLVLGDGAAHRVALVGDGPAVRRLVDAVKTHNPRSDIELYTPPLGAPPDFGRWTFNTLLEKVRKGEVTEAIVVDDNSPGAMHAIRTLLAMPVGLHVACDRYSFELRVRKVVQTGSVGLLNIAEQPIGPWGYVAKRAIDIAVGATALVILLPLLATIAAAIRTESPGPVIFRQRRHGKGRLPFDVCKFRTMYVIENGSDVRQATRGDARITRVGNLLRKTSLDELPQLINVLRGEMSLVGPRPHAIAHDEHYDELLDRYAHRLRVPPGMTGWAQIHGFRGPTESVEQMAERVRYDLEYIDNWSIWLDLEILLLTPFYGFVHRNAI